MKILAIEHECPDVEGSDFGPHLAAEARTLWDLQTAGIVREAYFRGDRDEAVLVLECESIDAAERSLASLPLVEAGLIEFELIPLRAYPGFARLFASDGADERVAVRFDAQPTRASSRGRGSEMT